MPIVGKVGDKAVLIIVDPEMKARMDLGDPFTLPLRSVGFDVDIEIIIGSATEEVIHSSTLPELIAHINRGFEYRPEDDFKPYLLGKVKYE